jgi:hypothetical protein
VGEGITVGVGVEVGTIVGIEIGGTGVKIATLVFWGMLQGKRITNLTLVLAKAVKGTTIEILKIHTIKKSAVRSLILPVIVIIMQ